MRSGQRHRSTTAARPLAAAVALVVVAASTIVLVANRGPSSVRSAPPQLTAARFHAVADSGDVTVSPAPGSRTADPSTQISFLGRPAPSLGKITVVGSRTGAHAGRLRAYSTGNGASFVPDKPFAPGERVTVHTSLPIAHADHGTFEFVVAHVVHLRAQPSPPALATDVPGVDHFASAPAVAPPQVIVDAKDAPIPQGDFFLAPKGPKGQAGPMIVAPDGALVWFDPLPDHEEAFDLNEQTLHGHRVLTWFQGEVVDGHGRGVAVIANDHYQTIAVVHGGNGTAIDLHDLYLTNRGTVFVTAYRTIHWTGPAGKTRVRTVFDGVIQEIDVKTGLVEEEWDSLDHVPVAASYLRGPKAPAVPFDYFHINGVQPLANGDLFVSSRNTSAAYLVDPADGGAVVWRLGGKASSFSMGPGTRFWYEHDARLRAGHVVTIFDDGANGVSPPKEPASRALVIHLDMAAHTATLVHAYTSSDHHVLASALGNVEVRPGGDVVVGWGSFPGFSVFNVAGQLLYDALLPRGDNSYRVFQHMWHGTPATRPSVAAHPSGTGATVAMSWNGATSVARWEVLTGASATSLHQVTTVADTGFETTALLQSIGPLVQVVALGADGATLGRSAVVASSG